MELTQMPSCEPRAALGTFYNIVFNDCFRTMGTNSMKFTSNIVSSDNTRGGSTSYFVFGPVCWVESDSPITVKAVIIDDGDSGVCMSLHFNAILDGVPWSTILWVTDLVVADDSVVCCFFANYATIHLAILNYHRSCLN